MQRAVLSRRMMMLTTAGFGLSACAGGGSQPEGVPSDASFPAPQSQPNGGFDAWVAGFKPRAVAAGISPQVVDAAFREAGYLPRVIELDRNQAEFTRSLEDYLAIAASAERVSTGRSRFAEYRTLLSSIEERYGVEAQVVCAIWGLESSFGARRGNTPIISAMATLAYDGRRGAFFEQQLIAALRIVQRGDISASGLRGSWAGAMGHTQFIPTSYQAYAVDFDGDGRRNIWSDDPTDALASAANYLKSFGWRRGQPWGLEVKLPAGFDAALTGASRTRSVSSWNGLGVRDMAGRPLRDHGAAAVIIPSGMIGPAFVIFNNFNVIRRYNNSQSYAIGIGHLGDRIAGGRPIQARFPADEFGMTIDQRRELQQRLTDLGYDTEGVDGVIGDNTRRAIEAFQRRNRLTVDGQPSIELLTILRRA